ncbi:PRC-barrel domain-containing protein [Caulobacter segnis]|uniref:PRC-barrel domain-containing protein n=1 Tax=Caulobacter segnis TaxID=88688 RepID=UPI0028599B0A|nr:PRC-barrel domain-containing protein [Caulobacter segnis]MDR6625357.1 sporulation protein YlmC with PRC-barrel domain [Caulobacter segnis]
MPLTKSKDILDQELVGRDGHKLGHIRETFVDLDTGRIEFLIVEAPGLVGASGKYHPVPWSIVRYDPMAKAFHADVAKDRFKGSPSYDRAQIRSADYAWDEQSNRYFEVPVDVV